MNQEERNKMLVRIRALAAMADAERNPNPNEVAVAAAKMQQLMDQYNISLLEVMENSETHDVKFTEKTCEGLIGSLKPWHWGLARVIARITSTRYFATGGYGVTLREQHSKTEGHHKGYRMSFFGSKGSVEFACELFDKWVITIDKMSVDATSKYIAEQTAMPDVQLEMEFQGVKQYRHLKGLGEQHPNVWRSSWLMGVIHGIDEKLREQEQERKNTRVGATDPDSDTSVTSSQPTVATAMVVYKEHLEKAYAERSSGFRHVGGSRSNHNWNASSQGRAVGRSLNLTAKELKG